MIKIQEILSKFLNQIVYYTELENNIQSKQFLPNVNS